ncbi:MAG: carbonic anhydrase [Deltaproteobacteria bacterium]|nr:carbonic anhydrase [Deltaproteobacteria bacterium]
MVHALLDKIINENSSFVEEHSKEYFLEHATGQKPSITLISCSDSRVQPHVLLDDPINEIFCVENIGNQMTSTQGSVDYGILHLKTPVLLILGHVDCGAVKAFMKGYQGEGESITKELDTLKPALSEFDDAGSFEEQILQNVQRNLDYQVKLAVERYHDLLEKGELTIIGAIYDFADSLGFGYGRIVLFNINGVTDPNEITALPVIQSLDKPIAISRI